MAYASPMKIANGLVLDFTVDNADTAADTFLGLNASGEVTQFASVPRSRVSGGGNITEATSSVLSITGGTAAVLTSGLTIQVLQAGAAQSGYLSTTDWNTFNNKLGTSLTSAYIYVGNGSNVATGVAVSGDITMSNAGVVAIASGVIVNTDINASAAIAVSKLAAVTASRVLGSDGSGFIQALDTATYPSLTELSYVKGVTSAIQTQLNNRLSVTLTSPTNGDVITYNGAAWVNSPSSTGVPTAGTTAQILRKIDNTNYNTEWHTLVAADITDVSSTAAELNLLDGVTTTTAQFNFLNTVSGNVQDQLDSKLGITLTQNYMWVGNGSNLATGLAPGTNGYVLTSVSGVPTWVNPGSGGTVTSINASGGTTGMSFTGGPVTTSGTLTLGGTLAVANGGTGLTALGTANQSIRVNAGATALEYYTPSVGSGDMILASTQTNTGAKSFNSGTFILKGATSGTTIFNAAATAGSTTITLPNFTGQALASGGTQALSGNTIIGGSGSNYNLSLGDTGAEIGTFTVLTAGATSISSSTASTSSLNVGDYIGSLRNGPRGYEASPTGIFIFANAGQYIEGDVTGFKFVLGSDASQDLYKRDPSGYLVRIPLGSSGDVLTNVSGTVGWAAPSGGGLTVGTSTITSGTNTRILYNNSGILGEYTVSGSGNVAMTTSPTFTTPALGTPSALVGTNITGTATGLTSGITNALKSATTTVDVSASTAPTSGQVLTATGGTAATWQTPSSGFSDPMTTRGDIIIRNASNITARLGRGTANQVLTSDGTDIAWQTPSGGSSVFSALTAATGTNTINNAAFAQEWQWNSLTSGNGLVLSSSSTAAASNTQTVFRVNQTGANATSTQTTYSGYFSNTKTGTSSTNVGLHAAASGGTTNYAGTFDGIIGQYDGSGGNFNYMQVVGATWRMRATANLNLYVGANTLITAAARKITLGYSSGSGSGETQSLETLSGAWTSIPTTTELTDIIFNSNSATWAWDAGTTTTQRFNWFKGHTVNGGTLTTAYQLYVDAPIVGTGTITNNYAAGFGGNIIATGNAAINGSVTVGGSYTTQGQIIQNVGLTGSDVYRRNVEWTPVTASGSSGNFDFNIFNTDVIQNSTCTVTITLTGVNSSGVKSYAKEMKATFRKPGTSDPVQVGSTIDIYEHSNDLTTPTSSVSASTDYCRVNYDSGTGAPTLQWTVFIETKYSTN